MILEHFKSNLEQEMKYEIIKLDLKNVIVATPRADQVGVAIIICD